MELPEVSHRARPLPVAELVKARPAGIGNAWQRTDAARLWNYSAIEGFPAIAPSESRS